MKKVLLLLAFVGSLACLYFLLKTPDSDPLYVSPKEQILPIRQEKDIPKTDQQALEAIDQINRRNANINTFVCEKIDIYHGQIKVTGNIAFEKPRRFRMTVKSILGKEMDLGSNDTHFWFWSRRMDPPVLHYAKHEDLGKTMLKTPLNPGWMMDSLNLGPIEAGESIRHNGFYGVITKMTSANGEPVTALVLISPEGPAVAGRYLYSKEGKMVASSEIKSHQRIGEHIVPKQMLIIWYQEGVSMQWELYKPELNVGIDPTTWSMPSTKNAIDLGIQTDPPKKLRR